MSTLPTELVIEILKLYFRYYTPSTPLDLPTTSLRHAVSLRLVNSSFHAIIDHSLLLFRSVLLRTRYDWLRYFDPKKGVLVKGKQARRRCEAVQELVFSFSAPELPLRKGFTPDDMGTDTEMYPADAHNWVAHLTIPLFSSTIRYVDLETERPRDLDYPTTQYARRLALLATEALLIEGLEEELEEEGDEDGMWMCRVELDVGLAEKVITTHALSPLFYKPIGHSGMPFYPSSIHIVDSRITDLSNLLFGWDEGGGGIPGIFERFRYPRDPYLVPSIVVHSKPSKSYWARDRFRPLIGSHLNRRYFAKLSFVDYPVGTKLRQEMKEELKDLVAELGPGGKGVISQWVWVEEDGSRTSVHDDTQSQESED